MKNKVIIIGNGAAGISAAESIVAQKSLVEVTILTNEDANVYFRPMLSEYLSMDALPKRFYLHDDAWYAEQNITLRKGVQVNRIDATAKQVVLSSGEALTYDKLILAAGSYNFVPPFPGADYANVYNLRTLADANAIRAQITKGKKAVVIGGGLLGLELGWQLLQAGLDVSVVEMMDRLLPRQLDHEASEIFMEKVLATGMKVLTGVGTKAIEGNDHSATGVALDNGDVLPADLVFISIGIRADIKLAQTADLKVNRGILVNSNMETSVADIYACGDCAEFEGINYAIWPEALAQGKTAGLSAIGIHQPYETVIPFNIYHGMNLRLFSMGDVSEGDDVAIKSNGNKEAYEKYFFKNDKIVGGILLGNIAKSSKLKKAIAEGITQDAFDL
ncbi:NAD(P)/FAD-dependent oxidoreductase [Fusibacter paucivorans]|uniref:NAD(P)/FAD-dependent oxidoreductase n=1 Tax=Fusibacter paucivorans TaxID=76009 RepID=A0ABS5PQ65_9FIRM|nr:FAD-dependent oxidoreductase [Fusibacter paucivorans]MBS7527309.1 NAD(P)/FAD-dependent oxidoreductase [Fusibacter paucivorans]